MVTLSEALPPEPEQTIVYVLEPVKLPTCSDPEVDLLPDHEPDAWQEFALVEVQCKVAFWPHLTCPE
jgi:hypothetical protein